RVSGMHLKPYLKLQKKERSPEIRPDSLQSPPMSHQRASQEEKYTNSCTKLSVFPKASLVPPSRKLLGIIYPNTMCNMNGKAPADAPSARERKTGPPATIHQGEEGEGPLDVWAVVKPGNTKEKIAFFAAQQCSGGIRLGSMKIKSPWDIDGRAAKRRKKAAAPGRGAGAAEPPCVEKCGPLSGAVAWDGPATRQPFPAGAPGGNGTSELRAEAPRVAAAAGAAALVQSDAGVCGEPGPLPKQHPARKEALCISISVTKTERGCRKDKLWNCGPGEEPLPGRLFFLQGDQPAAEEPQLPREGAPDAPGAAAPSEAAPEPQSPRGGPGTPTEPCALPAAPTEGALQVLDASCLKRQVSHDFLETRFKIQQLLEPQQYMAFLPHHIIVKIFGLLPTRSLVALKCTCCYFKFLIEYYNIRPADSRWVRDPRYREDPCKQCKKKYVKGDVSLCRWHPKPYCQALPYGPGYWMCCHRSQKGIPGCKLGLHDNHWVPACHSFNRALHKKARGAGAEAEDEC
ncbi:FBX34 protein, partial [Eudromia elegans]|nr:FBX34 protein [Eudromia elegans]